MVNVNHKMVASKKKFSIANRRLRERSNISFLFVLFFFALFCIIFVMETILPKPQRAFGSGNQQQLYGDEEAEDYKSNEDFNFDISFDEKSDALKAKKIISKNVRVNTSIFKKTVPGTNNNGNNQYKNVISVESDWQELTGTPDKFFVYSAYFVNDHIKIIGATKTHSKQHVQCRLYDNQTTHYSTIDGKIKTIRENWNLKYSACFIICNLPSKQLKFSHPTYVSITANKMPPSTLPSNRLKVQYVAEKVNETVDFSLCVKPIYLNYDNILHFLETIEFHRLMGIEHFSFFNHSIGSQVGCIMTQVYNSKLISILPWSLPFTSQKEIRTEGIFSALNDCVYRHRGKSKYLVMVDLDENIVPRKTNKYLDLIQQLDSLSNKKKIGAYSFQNAFFYLQFDDDHVPIAPSNSGLAQAVGKKLLMLRKTRRRARFHPHKERQHRTMEHDTRAMFLNSLYFVVRVYMLQPLLRFLQTASKYICDPNKVVEAGNHFVWEMEKGYYTLSVPTHLAALHHYRVCEFGGSHCIKSASVVDKTVQNFSEQLISEVAKKLEEASAICHVDIAKAVDPNNNS